MKKLIFILILIFGLKLFDLTLFGSTSWLNILAALSLIIIILGLFLNKRQVTTKQNFKSAIICFYIGLLVNFFVMYFYSELPLYNTLFSTLNYYGFLLYFYLHKYNITREFLTRTFFIFAGFVSILMITQQFFPDKLFFNQLLTHENFIGDRGVVRVRIPGMAFVVISCFLLFHKFIQKNKLITLIFFMTFFVVIFTQGFRSIFLAMIICFLFIYWRYHKSGIFSMKSSYITVILSIGVYSLFQINYFNNLFDEIFTSFMFGSSVIKENIRLETWSYYMIEIKTGWLSYFTGNGLKLPYETPENLYAVDLGIFGFFTLAGLIPTLALLWIFIKGATLKLDKQYLYITAFFVYIFINSFLFNAEAFRVGIFLIYSILLYMIDLNKAEQHTAELNEKQQ